MVSRPGPIGLDRHGAGRPASAGLRQGRRKGGSLVIVGLRLGPSAQGPQAHDPESSELHQRLLAHGLEGKPSLELAHLGDPVQVFRAPQGVASGGHLDLGGAQPIAADGVGRAHRVERLAGHSLPGCRLRMGQVVRPARRVDLGFPPRQERRLGIDSAHSLLGDLGGSLRARSPTLRRAPPRILHRARGGQRLAPARQLGRPGFPCREGSRAVPGARPVHRRRRGRLPVGDGEALGQRVALGLQRGDAGETPRVLTRRLLRGASGLALGLVGGSAVPGRLHLHHRGRDRLETCRRGRRLGGFAAFDEPAQLGLGGGEVGRGQIELRAPVQRRVGNSQAHDPVGPDEAALAGDDPPAGREQGRELHGVGEGRRPGPPGQQAAGRARGIGPDGVGEQSPAMASRLPSGGLGLGRGRSPGPGAFEVVEHDEPALARQPREGGAGDEVAATETAERGGDDRPQGRVDLEAGSQGPPPRAAGCRRDPPSFIGGDPRLHRLDATAEGRGAGRDAGGRVRRRQPLGLGTGQGKPGRLAPPARDLFLSADFLHLGPRRPERFRGHRRARSGAVRRGPRVGEGLIGHGQASPEALQLIGPAGGGAARGRICLRPA